MTETAPLLTSTLAIVTDAIQSCIDTGTSTSTVTAAYTSIDWPPLDQLIDACTTRNAQLTA